MRTRGACNDRNEICLKRQGGGEEEEEEEKGRNEEILDLRCTRHVHEWTISLRPLWLAMPYNRVTLLGLGFLAASMWFSLALSRLARQG